MKKIYFCLISAVCLSFSGVVLAQTMPTETVIEFRGELIDQNAVPLSGVLPLEFRIYADEKSNKPLASERHFVSVIDGSYSLSLGEKSKIGSKDKTLYVAVYLDNKLLTRQKVSTMLQFVPSSLPATTRSSKPVSVVGDKFKLECPKGYVVTGIEGSLDDKFGDLQLICSRIF